MNTKTFRLSSLHQAMFLAFTGFALWAFSDALIRALNTYPTVLVTCISGAWAIFFLCIFAPFLGGMRETIYRPKLKLRLLRGAMLACANFLAFVAFSNLELTKAYAIIFIAPIMSKILSVIIMKEQIRLRSWGISLLGFAGVLIVLRPGFVALDIGTLAALGLTGFFSLGYVLSRYIGEENQTALSMSLFQYVFVTGAVAFPAWAAYQDSGLTMEAQGLMVLIGAAAAIGSIIVAQAFARAPSASIAPIHYTQILWGLLFGILFFGEYPDMWTITGAGVIIAAGLLLLKFSRSHLPAPMS